VFYFMDFDEIIEGFSKSNQEKLMHIRERLEFSKDLGEINLELEKDIALICLALIDETLEEEESLMKTSFVLANSFLNYSFDERLNKAVNLFGELQIPVEFQEGRIFDLWTRAKEYLIMYLDDENFQLPKEEIFDEGLDFGE
jgi:hypothetical protein